MIYVGSAGWNIPRIHKTRFPDAGSQLERYAARLNAAEINTSFYRPHAVATYERWAASVPAGFRFAVKIPKVITHERGLTRAREPLERFLEEIAGLGQKLGPLLVQLPPSHAFDARRVGRFLDLLRSAHEGQVVCEPRHATWTSEAATRLLLKFRIARVAADPPRAAGLEAPGGWPNIVYYRWHGSPRPYFSPYSTEQLRALSVELSHAPAFARSASARSRRSFSGGGDGAGSGSPRVSVKGSPRGEARRIEVDAWCIFDNTGSGSAAGNALDLRGLLC